jgi:hypothetical protein
MLRRQGSAGLRVFVIWEPVIPTDWGDPSPAITAHVRDSRARHYWDKDRRLSAMYGGAARLDALAPIRRIGFQMKEVLWDVVLIYPPGVRWGEPASILLAPVVKFRDEIAGAL